MQYGFDSAAVGALQVVFWLPIELEKTNRK
jgi:hypothetical protein